MHLVEDRHGLEAVADLHNFSCSVHLPGNKVHPQLHM